MTLPNKHIQLKMHAWVLLVLLLAGCNRAAVIPWINPSPVPGANCTAGDYIDGLTSGGRVREFRLHVPESYRPEHPAALVLGFHGAGSNAEQFENYAGFSALSDREGFIVAYPQALGDHPTWITTAGPANPDIPFVSDLIELLKSRCSIDTHRIYAAGHSNGGGMANRLGCNLTEPMAAIGSVAGAYQGSEKCAPARPTPVIAVHGDRDPVIPYNGVENSEGPPAAYFVIGVPVPQWASSWAARNGCGMETSKIVLQDRVSGQAWTGCDARADVVLYTIEGGGHGWPVAFDAAQLLWDFFEAHPKIPG
jgi:polyhydroxybutyrate depolymerase